eukprot:Protomagalhaensia_wolfi_Nauph_80__6047@NODE_840_length_1955_cov_742_042276_g632_i0_p2_GENE_NODE_840_length_1955_cov_742_042276_g632_i0NODE_840_length_1955_cov_742_042276_g632_i0_p2_ORF_typecomplete_len113_score5_83_NODE_840_length_1955_cov_742_042276_g632_i0403741
MSVPGLPKSDQVDAIGRAALFLAGAPLNVRMEESYSSLGMCLESSHLQLCSRSHYLRPEFKDKLVFEFSNSQNSEPKSDPPQSKLASLCYTRKVWSYTLHVCQVTNFDLRET